MIRPDLFARDHHLLWCSLQDDFLGSHHYRPFVHSRRGPHETRLPPRWEGQQPEPPDSPLSLVGSESALTIQDVGPSSFCDGIVVKEKKTFSSGGVCRQDSPRQRPVNEFSFGWISIGHSTFPNDRIMTVTWLGLQVLFMVVSISNSGDWFSS